MSGSDAFRAAGVNRISFGVQSFDDCGARSGWAGYTPPAERRSGPRGTARPASTTSAWI